MKLRPLLPLLLAFSVADAAPTTRRVETTRRTAAAASPAALSAAEAQAVVTAHNALRSEVGAPPLAWNDSLATAARNHAQSLAASCTLAHASNAYGENLASWTGAGPAAHAVTLWGAEKPKYTGGGGPYTGAADGAGHYTQVIWAATTRIGCGRVTCTRQNQQWTLVVCNYDPRGNVLGQRVY